MALIDTLGEIPDPRRGNAQRHELLDILAIALVASVCGAESCVDFAEFAEDREPLLREFLRLENGLPSHDTFSRVFRLLDPAAFARAFEAFLADLGADGTGVLAIDGKTLRRSFDRAAARSPLHVVTAFGADARLSVGQRAVAPGENEITAARALLATLTLEGALVTGDAAHAQAETAALVLQRGGDYLFALKANRPAMLREVEAFFTDPPQPLATFTTTDADHGRIETRRHRLTHDVGWLFGDRAEPGAPCMPGLATLACRRGRARRGWPRQPRHPLLSLLRPPHPRALRPRRPRPLEHRKQPPLGPRRHLRRRRSPQPRRQRPGEPRHPAPADPQPAQQGPAQNIRQPQAKALRLVRRLRPNHHRPNAIALLRLGSHVDFK
jgi:predicted transposase YbfD/YdcC